MQLLVAEGKVPAGVAREAARFDDPEKQRNLIERAIQDGMTSEQVRGLASSASKPRRKAKQKQNNTVRFEFGADSVTVKVRSEKSIDYRLINSLLEQSLAKAREST